MKTHGLLFNSIAVKMNNLEELERMQAFVKNEKNRLLISKTFKCDN